MSILLTGGAGYIGSHTAVELLNSGYDVVIADNLYNSELSVIDRIEEITGKRPLFYNVDVANGQELSKVFRENTIDTVIHFAGYKAVGESVKKPLMYYRNNLDTTLTLLEVMKANSCHNIIFSSSATVYGDANKAPFTEDMPTGMGISNPYGWTKYMIEQILMDMAKADPDMSVVLLRYFNPIGAHESGLIGEKPNGIPNNLMPYITQTAAGIREKLTIFGDDYPTPDGSCVRDFIHVVDLAKGHVAACKYGSSLKGCDVFNLGTGRGFSVFELVNAFEKANGLTLPHVVGPRRAGDLAEVYADASKAQNILGWKAEKTIEDMCRDSWNWEKHNME